MQVQAQKEWFIDTSFGGRPIGLKLWLEFGRDSFVIHCEQLGDPKDLTPLQINAILEERNFFGAYEARDKPAKMGADHALATFSRFQLPYETGTSRDEITKAIREALQEAFSAPAIVEQERAIKSAPLMEEVTEQMITDAGTQFRKEMSERAKSIMDYLTSLRRPEGMTEADIKTLFNAGMQAQAAVEKEELRRIARQQEQNKR